MDFFSISFFLCFGLLFCLYFAPIQYNMNLMMWKLFKSIDFYSGINNTLTNHQKKERRKESWFTSTLLLLFSFIESKIFQHIHLIYLVYGQETAQFIFGQKTCTNYNCDFGLFSLYIFFSLSRFVWCIIIMLHHELIFGKRDRKKREEEKH